MVPDLLISVVCLVCAASMMRAHLRGDSHITARLAATASLALIAHFGYRAYLGRSSAAAAVTLAAFALVMLSIAFAQKRFHAPPH